MEKPEFKFNVKHNQKRGLVPTEKFLSAEFDYGDIEEELKELKDFHIEIHNELLNEIMLENPNTIKSICDSPVTISENK